MKTGATSPPPHPCGRGGSSTAAGCKPGSSFFSLPGLKKSPGGNRGDLCPSTFLGNEAAGVQVLSPSPQGQRGWREGDPETTSPLPSPLPSSLFTSGRLPFDPSPLPRAVGPRRPPPRLPRPPHPRPLCQPPRLRRPRRPLPRQVRLHSPSQRSVQKIRDSTRDF